MWNARLDEAQAGIKIARRHISNFRYADDTTLRAESKEKLEFLDERGEWTSGLKPNIQKTKIMASSPNISWQIDGERVGDLFIYLFIYLFILAQKSLQMVITAMKLKDACLLEEKLWQT